MVMQNCLYLVSSSASREYVSDCVEAIALPRGMIQHFRYLHKYVDKRLLGVLRQETNALPLRLRNLPVVVVYLYQDQTGGVWRPAEGAYVPLRCGRLIHAFSDGDVAHFYFEVGDYVKPKHRGVTPRNLLRLKKKKGEIRFQTSPAKKARPSYAHLAQDLGLAAPRTRDSVAFQKFVYDAYKPNEWRTRSLGSTPLDLTYDVIFFRVAGLFGEKGGRLRELTPVPRPIRGNFVAEYIMESGTTYHIKMTTHLFAPTPAQLPGQGSAHLRLDFDPNLIKPIGPTSIRLSSVYDLQYWSFVADCTRSQRSQLTIVCDHKVAVDRSNFVRRELLCPEISLPISLVAP